MPPKLIVKSVEQVFNDGAHNAFTDLCRFRGKLYLTFRSSPDEHGVVATSSIVVLRSDDGAAWEEAFRFNVQYRDVRDPHFLVFKGKLFVYSGAWLCDPTYEDRHDINDHLGYAAWTEDGEAWDGPRHLEGTHGHYIWRAAAFGDSAYLCGRRIKGFQPVVNNAPADREAALLASDDGLVWKFHSLYQETGGNETAFHFEEDGTLLALCRRRGPADIRRAQPPYTTWERKELDRFIGGPMLVKWAGNYLVGGRTLRDEGPRTTLLWLVDDRLEEIATLPSGGDNSYPGFVEMDDGTALLSYYSSHEGSATKYAPCHIYLARLALER